MARRLGLTRQGSVKVLYLLPQSTGSLEREDSATLYVLEAIIISMVLLGAAYAVSTLQESSRENVRPRAELGRVVEDALIVLSGLDDGNGTSLLDHLLVQAMHCAYDAAPSPIDCQGARSRNLSIKLDHYLPMGAGYAIALSNGVASREIYVSPLPEGEAVSASRGFQPEWNTSFVFTEFSCYPAATEINATIIPIDRARVSWARWANLTLAGAEYEGKRAHTPLWWNVTLPAARPSADLLRANTTGNATFPGLASYAECGHGGRTLELREALAAARFSPGAPTVPVSGTVGFKANLQPILDLPGTTVNEATVTVYAPLPPASNMPGSWLRAGDTIALTNGEGTWSAPPHSLYGTHVALLRVSVTVGSDTFELRRATTIDLALPTGEVPIHAPYRATVRAWLADWG